MSDLSVADLVANVSMILNSILCLEIKGVNNE